MPRFLMIACNSSALTSWQSNSSYLYEKVEQSLD